ncbi:hypothetical protein F2981_19675 (plasmid) [Sinorhizobium meliloti]|nr:hypothetical protein [Sinorhizobium meliloti]
MNDAARYELTDHECHPVAAAAPTSRVACPRVDDRRVLNGILGGSGRALTGRNPERYGPPTTCYNRFVRCGKPVLGPATEAVPRLADGDIVMIDRLVRVHAARTTGKRGMDTMAAWDVPGRVTEQIHALVDAEGRPVNLRLTGGQIADCTQPTR